jgi:hypothetical protein
LRHLKRDLIVTWMVVLTIGAGIPGADAGAGEGDREKLFVFCQEALCGNRAPVILVNEQMRIHALPK